jgi:hypothetical protein
MLFLSPLYFRIIALDALWLHSSCDARHHSAREDDGYWRASSLVVLPLGQDRCRAAPAVIELAIIDYASPQPPITRRPEGVLESGREIEREIDATHTDRCAPNQTAAGGSS